MSDPSYIKVEGWPPDHAQKAYDSGFYIEAIQVLHGYIENKLQELLILSGATARAPTQMSETWVVANEIPMNAAVKALFVIGTISHSDYTQVRRFNSIRNRLIHRIFLEPYEKAYPGIPGNEYTEAFDAGKSLCDDLDLLSHSLIETTKS
jgi:hypothetical protein